MVLTYMIPYMYLNLSDEKVGASFLLAFELTLGTSLVLSKSSIPRSLPYFIVDRFGSPRSRLSCQESNLK